MWRKGVWLLALIPQWGAAAGMAFSFGTERFLWEEYADGRRLLQESGLRHFVGLEIEGQTSAGWGADARGRFYLGEVAYDGETWAGDPLQSDTGYAGYQLEAGLVPVQDADGVSLRTAVGLDNWWRVLGDTALADGTPVMGYEEHYTLFYGAVEVHYRDAAGWALGLGTRLPLWTNEAVNIGGWRVSLEPEGRLSVRAGLEVAIDKRWDLRLDYDSYSLGASDPRDGVYQPEIRQETLAASLHYRF